MTSRGRIEKTRTMSKLPAIAFLGLGAMGSRMAARLIGAGFAVTVWNRSPDRARPLADLGATVSATPRRAAEGAGIVLSMVRDDEASRMVWLDAETGALGGMARGAIAVECSTLTVAHVRILATEAAKAGIRFLDAPVAGSRPQAEAGQLIFMVGGDVSALDDIRPVLAAMGGAVHHVGASGAGAVLKLAVNALFGIQVAALAELAGLLESHGIDLARAFEIIGATPVMSPAAKGAASSMLAGDFAPMFPVELVEKDFGHMRAAGGDAVPMAEAARSVMQAAMAAGFGGDNLTGVVRLYSRNDRRRPS